MRSIWRNSPLTNFGQAIGFASRGLRARLVRGGRRMMRASRLAPLCLALAVSHHAQAVESVYTDLLLEKCRTLVEPDAGEPGGDFMSSLCPGLGKYPVLFKEGDLRQSIHYGFLKPSILSLIHISEPTRPY